jgi:hypothetical protein
MPSVMNAAGSRLEKAYLSIMPASPDGVRPQGGKTLTFKFNPTEYSISKSANWRRSDAQDADDAGPVQWGGTQPRTMSLTIHLDESESASGSVLSDAQMLFDCCSPTTESIRDNKPSGPYVLFGWGSTTTFSAFVKSVNVQYTMFRADGIPFRAVANLEIEEVEVAKKKQNPTSGALGASRTHTVVAGETLPLIAYAEYRDPALWRLIADANAVDDPFRLRAGTQLLLPAGDQADRSLDTPLPSLVAAG